MYGHDIMEYFAPIQRFLLTVAILNQLTITTVSGLERYGLRKKTELKDILPSDYDSYQTPTKSGNAANVTLQIELLNIRSVNVAEMSYIADIFLYKSWKDWRLRYPANKTLEKIALNPDWRKVLWTPDVYFHNAIEGKVQDTIIPYVYLWLKNDSTVVFGARLSLQFSCDMMLHNFPHDTQCCDIIIKSLTHTRTEMNLQWNSTAAIVVGDFIVLPQFEYVAPDTQDCQNQMHLSRRGGDFACLRGVIKLNRRAGYYVINIYIPTILIVFMSMLTFWIPPEAVPGRVTLGVTSILTIITKQYQASLPNVSYVVALNVWLSCCIGFVFCSLLEYAAVIALLARQKRKSTESIPTSTNVHAAAAAAQTAETSWEQFQQKLMRKIEDVNCHTIDRVSRLVFPLVFAFQCVVYWAYYTRLEDVCSRQ